MTKQERAIKARAHYEDIKTRLAANTKLSIERTYVYSPDSFTQHESGNQKPAFTLTDMDSVNLSDNGRTAILNYASYKSPGGFFLEGSRGSLGLWSFYAGSVHGRNLTHRRSTQL